MNSWSNKLVSDKQHSIEHSCMEIANTAELVVLSGWAIKKKVGEGEDL